MFELKDKVAIVTGGESGIGYAIGKAYAAQGAKVILVGLLEDLGAQAELDIRAEGGSAVFRQLDVRDSAAIDALFVQVENEFGPIDILVNNAGVGDGSVGALETSDELFDLVMGVNLRGAFCALRAALRGMTERRSGRIINVASVAALRVSVNGMAYTMSKFGMAGMTRHAAVKYAETGVTVNAICPGFTSTQMAANTTRIAGDVVPSMQKTVGVSPDGFKQFVPAHRRGTVEEIAALAVFFASDEAAYVTGQIMAVDGGWSAS